MDGNGVTVVGLDHVLARYTRRLRSIEYRKQEFLGKLAEIGIETASVSYANAEYDGVNDVVVAPEPYWVDDDTLLVSASGKAILFIEFGSGVYNPDGHPFRDRVPGLSARGEYGGGHGKQPFWGFTPRPGTTTTAGGVRSADGRVVITRGNRSNMAMYHASKAIKERIREIAKEVFHD